jgi:hypothetical protein
MNAWPALGCTRASARVSIQAFLGCIPLTRGFLLDLGPLDGLERPRDGRPKRVRREPNAGWPPHNAVAVGGIRGRAPHGWDGAFAHRILRICADTVEWLHGSLTATVALPKRRSCSRPAPGSSGRNRT